MIIFFGSAEIIAILFILLAILAGSAEAIIGMIDFFIVAFIIKNIVQTVFLGFIKNKNPLSYTIAFLITDVARMWIFFSNLKSVGMTFVHATGLKYFAALFGFILYFLICGCVFMIGEGISLMQASGNKKYDQIGNNTLALFAGIGTVLVLALVIWIGYL